MRTVIGALAVLAVATGAIAYGPRIGGEAAKAETAAAPAKAAPAKAAPVKTIAEAVPVNAAPAKPAPVKTDVKTVAKAPAKIAPVKAALARASHASPLVGLGKVIPGTGGLRYFGGTIRGSLYGTLERHLDHDVADPLTSVVKRLLVWWVNPRRDIERGDRLEVLYSLPAGDEPVVHALAYTSSKRGRTFHAYLWKAPGDRFAHYFDARGVEVAERFVHSPVLGYQQITALLGDGRHHRGIDFKTPPGTPVHAPYGGVVRRVDWRRRLNGNCVDVHFGNGEDAYFLHLSRLAPGLRPGRHVAAGQVLAFTGDTGHSFAPHLHYQLMRGRRVLNPLRAQKTYRAKVPAKAKKSFEEAKQHLQGVLDAERRVS